MPIKEIPNTFQFHRNKNVANARHIDYQIGEYEGTVDTKLENNAFGFLFCVTSVF